MGGVISVLAMLLLAASAVPSAAADPSAAAPGSGAAASPLPPACDQPLQALVDAAPPGSQLHLPACTSTSMLTIRVPLSLDARGTLIDGRGALTHAVLVSADDVEIIGMSVARVANPAQDGAVQAWDVRDFAFRGGSIYDAAGACISVARSPEATIEDSVFARCGQEGIHATQADGLVVRGNRIEGNNPAHQYDPEWEAGGAKVTQSRGVLFERNEVSGNGGPGIWCDIDCRDLTVRDNRVWDNDRTGVQVEISDGAHVTRNAVWENGWAKPTWGWGAGILVSSSRAVHVEANVLAWNADGIVVVSQDRGDAPSPITGNRTSGNIVAAQAGNEIYGLAWLQDWSGSLFDASAGNGGSGDSFWFDQPESAGEARFAWDGAFSQLEPFRATPGGAGATYASEGQLTALLRATGIPVEPSGRHPARLGYPRALIPVAALALGAGLVVAAVIVLRRRRNATLSADGDPSPEERGPREI